MVTKHAKKVGLMLTALQTDPKYLRTRENNAEFGRAMKATKLFKNAFQSLIVKGADSSLTNRLAKEMVKIVKNDSTNDRGKRMVLDAETELLCPFEFNLGGAVASTIRLQYKGIIYRETGICRVMIQEFVPTESIIAPEGATHFKFKAAAVMLDFENTHYELNITDEEFIPHNNNMVQFSSLECLLPPALTKPLFLAFGIDFYQMVNGKYYSLNNGARNGLCIIQVSGT